MQTQKLCFEVTLNIYYTDDTSLQIIRIMIEIYYNYYFKSNLKLNI